MTILGISAYYHDAAAALVRDGEIVAAAQEERFSRKKHDDHFPTHAIQYCCDAGNLARDGLDAVVFYDKPLRKFRRILETHFSIAPRGLRAFVAAMPLWLRQKLWVGLTIERTLARCGVRCPDDVLYTAHHEAHAASAFFPSPFERAAILTIDGVGEYATSELARGEGNRIEYLKELRYPHSLGLLYSAFTYFTGFRINAGEYKLMGLAPYGEPKYVDLILDKLVRLYDDGSLRLNLEYFGFLGGLTMTNARFARLFGGKPRVPESAITRREMDLARSIQVVTEEVVLRMARHLRAVTGERHVCLAGGVALNCVANGRLLRDNIFDGVWVQPAAGDAGGALGAALCAWHQFYGRPRQADGVHDRMRGACLGPSFSDEQIGEFLTLHQYPAIKLAAAEWADAVAALVEHHSIVGLFQGRMEYGPRALGCRSIIGDARAPHMQSLMNLKTKRRESFRPFAPACLRERVSDYFELEQASPYMLLTAPVRSERRRAVPPTDAGDLLSRINQVRSDIPAVTHVDYSARVQTVDAAIHPHFHAILKAFERRTGCGVIINTSFNVRGEPIVCTLEDAYRCFMTTHIEYLVLGSYLLDKRAQPPWRAARKRRRELTLDGRA